MSGRAGTLFSLHSNQPADGGGGAAGTAAPGRAPPHPPCREPGPALRTCPSLLNPTQPAPNVEDAQKAKKITDSSEIESKIVENHRWIRKWAFSTSLFAFLSSSSLAMPLACSPLPSLALHLTFAPLPSLTLPFFCSPLPSSGSASQSMHPICGHFRSATVSEPY